MQQLNLDFHRSSLNDLTDQNRNRNNRFVLFDSSIKNGVEFFYPISITSITSQDAYSNKSLEEIRYEDYLINRKYPEPKNVIKSLSKSEGTHLSKYKPVPGVDFKTNKYTQQSDPKDTLLTHICTMLEYEKFSPEELRFSDYKNGLKFKKNSGKSLLINPKIKIFL